MADLDFLKALGSLLSKKGGNLKLAMILLIPAAALLDFAETGYSISAHTKDSAINIGPSANMTPSDNSEQTDSADESTVEDDTSE